jgi:hypothetical protein
MLLAAALVFFMQPGFALVEAGFTRSKNTANILMKNFVDFLLGSLLYWAIGFGLMFGVGGFVGAPHFFDLSFYSGSLPTEVFLISNCFLCNSCNHRFGSNGRAYQIFCIPCLYSNFQCYNLSSIGHDLGRRLAENGAADVS